MENKTKQLHLFSHLLLIIEDMEADAALRLLNGH